MNNPYNSVFQTFNQRLSAIETTLTRKENILIFLMIRFCTHGSRHGAWFHLGLPPQQPLKQTWGA